MSRKAQPVQKTLWTRFAYCLYKGRKGKTIIIRSCRKTERLVFFYFILFLFLIKKQRAVCFGIQIKTVYT